MTTDFGIVLYCASLSLSLKKKKISCDDDNEGGCMSSRAFDIIVIHCILLIVVWTCFKSEFLLYQILTSM